MDLTEQVPAWVREEAPTLPAPGLGRDCSVCGWWKPASEFGPKAGGKYGLREHCRRCHRDETRLAAQERLTDPEERAKHVLRQRATKGYLSWQLWRELREQKRCAEWLREHPYSRPSRGPYGYVYVLMTFAEEVLYVGQTIDVETRLFIQSSAHKFDKEWFHEVALIDVYTYHAKDFDEGERWLIQQLNPVYNKVRPKPRRETPPEPLSVVRGAV